jgi:transketolase
LGVDRFGVSAPGGMIMEKFGFTVDNVYAQAKALFD